MGRWRRRGAGEPRRNPPEEPNGPHPHVSSLLGLDGDGDRYTLLFVRAAAWVLVGATGCNGPTNDCAAAGNALCQRAASCAVDERILRLHDHGDAGHRGAVRFVVRDRLRDGGRRSTPRLRRVRIGRGRRLVRDVRPCRPLASSERLSRPEHSLSTGAHFRVHHLDLQRHTGRTMNRLVAALVFLASVASADTRTIADYKDFRALSIDLVGRFPTRDEIGALEKPGFDRNAWIDAHVGTPQYAARLTRIYMDLLRLEVSNAVQVTPAATTLRRIQDLRTRQEGRSTSTTAAGSGAGQARRPTASSVSPPPRRASSSRRGNLRRARPSR